MPAQRPKQPYREDLQAAADEEIAAIEAKAASVEIQLEKDALAQAGVPKGGGIWAWMCLVFSFCHSVSPQKVNLPFSGWQVRHTKVMVLLDLQ